MNIKTLLSIGAATALLAGCNGGDIKIAPTTTSDNSINNSVIGGGSSADDVCASYVTAGGQTKKGKFESATNNCRYDESFVSSTNRLTVDLTIPTLANGGAHVFEGSLFVGETYDNDADMAAAGITKGGDGPTLTIEAGAVLAFQSKQQFLVINRGSQIIAQGREDLPIVITSVSDVSGFLQTPEDVSQWGGVVINGFGVTNQCVYTGTVAGGDLATTDCNVDAEGSAGDDESQYGGDNNADNSGILEYVIVKHTGATVGNGDELNGISFGAVGSGTTVNNIEMYSTYDDGVEMFGGAVNITNYVAVYVRDDAIDMDEGYSGTFTNALVIQAAADGQNCIESDGIADYSHKTDAVRDAIIAQGINSRPTINNLTCIISPNANGTHGSGAGWLFREGIWPTINDSMVIGSFSANDTTAPDDNYCLSIRDSDTLEAAANGDLNLNHVIFACAERTTGNTIGAGTEEDFAIAEGAIFATIPNGTAVSASTANDPALQLLEGTGNIFSVDYATSQVDGAAPGAGSDPSPRTYLGALSLGDINWTRPWAYGIEVGNRGEALWFEGL